MKFAVYGAGAVGAVMAARLSAAGEEVAVIARGEHLAAIRQRGLLVRSKVFGDMECRPAAAENPAEIGPVDVVLLTVKAHALTAIAPKLSPLLGAETALVSFQNGLPWWYFHGAGGRWEGGKLESVDPGGVIAQHINIDRVIGGLAYCSSTLVKPGVVDHLEGHRFPIGEPRGGTTERTRRIATSFTAAGLKCPIRSDMRREIWVKLMGNAPLNPVSAITRAPLDRILANPATRRLVAGIMDEVRAVAGAVGVETAVTTEQRIAGAEGVGPHKTSMLQDLEAGRHPEIEPIVGAVLEVAAKANVPAPQLQAVYGCAKLLFEQQLSGRT